MTERRAYVSVVCAESLAQAESSGQGSFFSPVVDGSNTTKLSSTCQHGFRSDSSASEASMAGVKLRVRYFAIDLMHFGSRIPY